MGCKKYNVLVCCLRVNLFQVFFPYSLVVFLPKKMELTQTVRQSIQYQYISYIILDE